MKSIFKILCLAALLVVKPAFGITPENGWWWNPAEPGTGYNIETQNGTLFVALFIYDEAGNPVWYSGSGDINRNNRVTVDLLRFEDGPCLGCIYTSSHSNSIGKQLALTFDSESTATVTLDGVDRKIERFSFKLGDGLAKLLGSWVISSLPKAGTELGVGNLVVCQKTINDDATALCVGTGYTETAGAIVPSGNSDGGYISIIPISATKNMIYLFEFSGLNKIGGFSIIVDSSASSEEISRELNDNGEPTFGFRFVSLQELENSAASQKSASAGLGKIATDTEIIRQANALASFIDDEMFKALIK